MTITPDVPVAGPIIPGRLDLLIAPGSPLIVPLEWMADDTTSMALNTDGYLARVEWTSAPPGSVIPPTPTIVITDGSPNMVISLTAAQTEPLVFRALGWTLHVTDPQGLEWPWLAGTVTLGGLGR